MTEETYKEAWDVGHFMAVNYERACTRTALQCGIPPSTFEGEKAWQSVRTVVAANAERALSDELTAQREVEIALLQQAFPELAKSSEIRASLINSDGKHRKLPLGVIRGVLEEMRELNAELNAESFAAAAQELKESQDRWHNKWLDLELKKTIDTVVNKCSGIDRKNLLGDKARAAVKDALGLLPIRPPHDPIDNFKDQIQRVAEGALIAQDLLARVRKSRQRNDPPSEGYSRQEQLQFEEVMQSLILPGGSNYGCDLALAHKVLRPKADKGAQVTLATFEWAGQEHEVTLKPLAKRPEAKIDDAGSDEGSDDEHRLIERSPPPSPPSSPRGDDLDPPGEGAPPNDEVEGVPVDHASSLTVVSPFARGHDFWVTNNIFAVLANARGICGKDTFANEDLARETVCNTIAEFDTTTTTQKQAIRAAEGALIEQHLLHVMAEAEKSDGRGEDKEKRQQLKAVIASVFHPNGPDNGLLVSAAYKALVYCVQDVDRPLSPEDNDFKSMALRIDREERSRSGNAPPVASASISKSSTNAASAPDSSLDPVAHIDRPEAKKEKKAPTPHLEAALLRVSRQTELRVDSVDTTKALKLIELADFELAKKSLLPANAEDADLRRAAEVGIIASAFSEQVNWKTEDAAKCSRNWSSRRANSVTKASRPSTGHSSGCSTKASK